MSTFDDREQAFENKFAHDGELQFKAMARRNKLLGLWTAGKMAKKGEDAAAYAKEVVMADFDQAGDEDVLCKVYADLAAAGIAMTKEDVRREMNLLMDEARRQVWAERG